MECPCDFDAPVFCLALFLFLKGKDRPRYWVFSALSFGLCLYTYSAARVFVPVFLIGLIWIYRDDLKRRKFAVCISASLFLVIFTRLFLFWITPEGMDRAQELVKPDLMALIHNYITYFMPDFLFLNGDTNLRHSIPGMGQLYHIDVTKLSFDEGGKALLIMRPEDVPLLNQVDYGWQKVHQIEDPSGKEIISLIEAMPRQ